MCHDPLQKRRVGNFFVKGLFAPTRKARVTASGFDRVCHNSASFLLAAVSRGMNFTLSRDDMIIAPMGDFVNQPVVYVGSMLGCYVRKFSPFFLAKLPQRRTYLLRKLKRRSEHFAPAGATKGAALGARKLL
ncbi:MAG: hypothetical protein IJF08_10270 [Clostridia bacterium]|nr:hypothetical protein [Clostridia bacterium]